MPESDITLPLFPLPHCVLLPGALLPVHVFERRYRLMTQQVLEQLPGGRRIATALLVEGHESLAETSQAPIHPVVCVSQIVEHAALPDGRYNLILAGLWRARVIDEDQRGPFRMARVRRMVPSVQGFNRRAVEVLTDIQQVLADAIDCGVLERRLIYWITDKSSFCEQFVDLLAYHVLPQDEPELKQAVLEEGDIQQRAAILTDRIRQMVEDRRGIVEDGEPPAAWPPAGRDN